MKMTSRIALVAAAGFLIGATTSAKAADLGSGCCADLEERVAELEATTARKGNRVVSLQVYGQVGRALLWWDDGIDSDVYVVDDDNNSTRVGFTGSGTIKPGLTTGFKIEFNVQEADSTEVDQASHDANDDNGNTAGEFDIRHAYVYIESDTLGRFTIGQQSIATDGIAQINLGGSGVAGDATTAAGFLVRNDFTPAFGVDVTWGDLLVDGDGGRSNAIRYDTPSLYGFILSASWGEDDFFDIAARFSKEWNSIRIAAGIGYRLEDPDEKSFEPNGTETETVAGSASVMHVPTGLFVHFSASDIQKDFAVGPDGDKQHWYVQAGVTKNYFGYGNTTLYGGYGQADTTDFGLKLDGAVLDETDANQWTLGVVQNFDSAALQVFVHYLHYELDSFGIDGPVPEGFNPNVEDFDAVLAGMVIKF